MNTKADLSKVKNKDLRALLEYINTQKATDEFTQEIDNAVKEQRRNSLERSRYMTFEQELIERQDMWYEQGINKNKKDVVLGMKEEGLSTDKISKIVKLSINQVNEILATNSSDASSITLSSK